MSNIYLKLNHSKTEFLLLINSTKHSRIQARLSDLRRKTSHPCQFAPNAKCLGFTPDIDLSLKDHITSKIKTAWYHLSYLKKVKSFLSKPNCKTRVQTLLITHVDGGNKVSIAVSTPLWHLRKTSYIRQNASSMA